MAAKSKEDREYERRLADLAQLLKEEGNKECAECGTKGPTWASFSLGVFLCINCAGIHRSLGTHISRVRSATLDKWTEEQLQYMKDMGNVRARAIYEARLPANYQRPHPGSPAHVLEAWIRAKYEKKQFMRRDSGHEYESTSTGGAERAEKERRKQEQQRRREREEREQREREQQQAAAALRSRPPPPAAAVPVVQPPAQPQQPLFGFDNGGGAFFSPSFPTPTPTAHTTTPTPVPTPTAKPGAGDSFLNEMISGSNTSQNAAKDKDAIMSLFAKPIPASTSTSATLPFGAHGNTAHHRMQPNYNVALTSQAPPTTMAFVGYPAQMYMTTGQPMVYSSMPASTPGVAPVYPTGVATTTAMPMHYATISTPTASTGMQGFYRS